MKKYLKTLIFVLMLVVLTLGMVACNGENNVVIDNANEPVVEEPIVEEVEPEAVVQRDLAFPYVEQWQTSAHAAFDTEPFRHWDGDDPQEVAPSCAKCHSSYGFQDFLGVDGSEFGVVDAAAPVDSVVDCVACHNEATKTLDSVVMPSGVEITGLGSEARCMQCHQGRASKATVDGKILDMEPDTVNEELGFVNIHYYAAAATKYGTVAKGGYEYEGKSYDSFFVHVEDVQSCIDCHDPHTLEIQLDTCVQCHEVETVEDLKNVRMEGSLVDYDGDGDIEEGVFYEIAGLQELTYSAIQSYAADNGGAIIYESHTYPYFFFDTDGDGAVTEGEANYGNQYKGWTPRLLKAAYNYQMSLKDGGAFAHGGKYVIQLLVDSIEDLGTSVEALRRIDHGHFAGSEEAFRHWDEDGAVSGSCAKCHTSEGLPFFAENGLNLETEISNGFLCETCHGGGDWPARLAFTTVTFPSGLSVVVEEANDSMLCMNCHQGRESGQSIAKLVDGLAGDVVADSLKFKNVHYFPAGGTRYGADVNVGYEFPGKTYAGFFEHVDSADSCVECHDAHELEVQFDLCINCHEADSVEDIRASEADFDGDGDIAEGLYGEVATLKEAMYAAMVDYSTTNADTATIIYDAHSYPYFFVDTNGDGVGTPDEINYGNQYNTWTPNLLAAAYNYQLASKDPGGFAHNGAYIIQLIIDSTAAVGGDVSAFTRP